MLIYCVSKLNWRTDAWLQCNKNKVPLLNSLSCFFFNFILIFFIPFSSPTCTPPSSFRCQRQTYPCSEPVGGGLVVGVGPCTQASTGFSGMPGVSALGWWWEIPIRHTKTHARPQPARRFRQRGGGGAGSSRSAGRTRSCRTKPAVRISRVVMSSPRRQIFVL